MPLQCRLPAGTVATGTGIFPTFKRFVVQRTDGGQQHLASERGGDLAVQTYTQLGFQCIEVVLVMEKLVLGSTNTIGAAVAAGRGQQGALKLVLATQLGCCVERTAPKKQMAHAGCSLPASVCTRFDKGITCVHLQQVRGSVFTDAASGFQQHIMLM